MKAHNVVNLNAQVSPEVLLKMFLMTTTSIQII